MHAVAAVDFQYVGGGCGVKDVVYLLGCLPDRLLAARADALLDDYFRALRAALRRRDPALDGAAVEAAWRALYTGGPTVTFAALRSVYARNNPSDTMVFSAGVGWCRPAQ